MLMACVKVNHNLTQTTSHIFRLAHSLGNNVSPDFLVRGLGGTCPLSGPPFPMPLYGSTDALPSDPSRLPPRATQPSSPPPAPPSAGAASHASICGRCLRGLRRPPLHQFARPRPSPSPCHACPDSGHPCSAASRAGPRRHPSGLLLAGLPCLLFQASKVASSLHACLCTCPSQRHGKIAVSTQ